jgi:hypothetical protein
MRVACYNPTSLFVVCISSFSLALDALHVHTQLHSRTIRDPLGRESRDNDDVDPAPPPSRLFPPRCKRSAE